MKTKEEAKGIFKKKLLVSTPRINKNSFIDEFLNPGLGTRIYKVEQKKAN